MTLFQAGMGFGILLLYLGKVLLFVVMPFLIVGLTVKKILQERKDNVKLSVGDYFVFALKNFLYAILIIVTTILLLFVLLMLINPTFD